MCGDHVICGEVAEDRDQILECLPRKNELLRKTEYATKSVAANIDTIIIVCAVAPRPSLELIDQYIVAAEQLSASAVITLNKLDLNEHESVLDSIKNKYSALPYPIITTSQNHSLDDMQTLLNQLQNKTCIFVGQSGVGKSTLINALVPNLEINTQEISDISLQGRHTTSTTTLYDLPLGGELIDSPGVREFLMPKLNARNISNGFVEISRLSSECKFHDCRHLQEPQCAVVTAVENEIINTLRYESYSKMIINIDEEKY